MRRGTRGHVSAGSKVFPEPVRCKGVLGRSGAIERLGSVGSVSHWAMTGGLQRKPGVETRQGAVLLVGDEGR